MAFDFKKEYKEFYLPKNKAQIVTMPRMNYIAVRGKGNPNEEGGQYKTAIGDRKSTRLNSSHRSQSRMPSSA